MIIDIAIILTYFAIIFFLGVIKRTSDTTSASEFFLKSRSLRWPSIALSTIATNIHAGHFLGMCGSAYLYGLAQANFEINAIEGILIAAFFFVPFYLKERITTISQYFEYKLGPKVALTYSSLMILMYAFLYLGSTLFWGAYAINALFSQAVGFISPDPMIRIFVIAVVLGGFSATYTCFGGLGAVVRTDIAQFVLLVLGGILLTIFSLNAIGGWSMLYEKSGNLMHLHLPSDHPKLPWPAILGMMLLNLNYWGCNQVILQRALAAKNLYHAQIGLIAGGFLKYIMAAIIIIPGIALAALLADHPLSDPDMAFPTLVNKLLPSGLKGLILCGLFASLMSSVDSIFHSVSTLWSIDIYKRYINPTATDQKIVRMGKRAIWGAFLAGALFTWVNVYVKFDNPASALTHWFNEVSYYIKNGFVFLIICAIFLLNPSRKLVFGTLLGSVVFTILLKWLIPDMNYLNRSAIVITATTLFVAVPTVYKNGWPLTWNKLFTSSSKKAGWWGFTLLASLIFCHIIFH